MKKRYFLLALMLTLCLAVFVSCSCSHRDANDDTKCDICDESYTDGMDICNHRDANDDSKCEYCGEEYADEIDICYHRDANDDNLCDKCGLSFDDGSDCQHRDIDDNTRCDKCNKIYKDGVDICVHKDANDDSLCDKCKAPFDDGTECQHFDNDDNFLCDGCGIDFNDGLKGQKVYVLDWSERQKIVIKSAVDSRNLGYTLAPTRYLSGENAENGYHSVDAQVNRRNRAAADAANVSVSYSYFPDTALGWARTPSVILGEVLGNSTEGADIYITYVYDILKLSLKGGLHNLYATKHGDNHFEFSKSGFDDFGSGYQYEYMKSISVSKLKMYCLASDYIVDNIRAAAIVPVNASLLESISVSTDSEAAFNSDRDGDGDFDISDLYELVYDGQWSYSALIDFSAAISHSNGDSMGFSVSSNSSIAAAGLLYSTPVDIIISEYKYESRDYRYYYWSSASLVEVSEAICSLFTDNAGISVINDNDISTGATAEEHIRSSFANNKLLFGGVSMLGALDETEYRNMRFGDGRLGYGILPVPLYRELNPETGEPDNYVISIRSYAQGAAIAYRDSFSACSAFLDYASLYSGDVWNAYMESYYSLPDEDGENVNLEMLRFIRSNVGSCQETVLGDLVDGMFSDIDMAEHPISWHYKIMSKGFKPTSKYMAQEFETIYRDKENYLRQIYNEIQNKMD